MDLFDTHAHYNDEKFNEDREELLQKIYNSGVTKIINVGYNLEASEQAIEIANKYDFMYAACGIHPSDIPETIEEFGIQLSKLEKMVIENKSKVVAIGEIGLDYHWNAENKEMQKQCFIKQIELANKLNLPIAIHSRDAIMDTLDVLKNNILPIKPSVFHCCPLNVDLVREALKLGFYISFAGPVTFKNSKNAKEIVEMVPLDKMVIETDCPYLAPEPVRGTRNDSSNVKHIATKIAEFRNVSVDEIAEITYKNAVKLFGV